MNINNNTNLEALQDKAVDMLSKLERNLPSYLINEFHAYCKISERCAHLRGYNEAIENNKK